MQLARQVANFNWVDLDCLLRYQDGMLIGDAEAAITAVVESEVLGDR